MYSTHQGNLLGLWNNNPPPKTCRKLQSRGELVDSAEANHDNLNAIDWNMNLSPAANGTVNDNEHHLCKCYKVM